MSRSELMHTCIICPVLNCRLTPKWCHDIAGGIRHELKKIAPAPTPAPAEASHYHSHVAGAIVNTSVLMELALEVR